MGAGIAAIQSAASALSGEVDALRRQDRVPKQ